MILCRSAATKHAGADIDDTTKTGETGTYVFPDFICDLIDRNGTAARFPEQGE